MVIIFNFSNINNPSNETLLLISNCPITKMNVSKISYI